MLAFFFRRMTSLVLPRLVAGLVVVFIVSFVATAILDIDLLLMIGVATVVGEVKVVVVVGGVDVVDVVPLFCVRSSALLFIFLL